MPIKDPERKKEVMKAWRQRVMPQGYGKWLYERRKLRFTDADEFRVALEKILSDDCQSLEAAQVLASKALADSRQREEQLGRFQAEAGEPDE